MNRILIVEDEEALRNVYVMLFEMQNYKVYSAANGKLALDNLKSTKPDIIILDVLMPVMGGIDFLETVDIRKTHPKTKVLVLSNLSDPKTVKQIEKLGAHKYLLKSSISPNKLVSEVESLLAGK